MSALLKWIQLLHGAVLTNESLLIGMMVGETRRIIVPPCLYAKFLSVWDYNKKYTDVVKPNSYLQLCVSLISIDGETS